MRKKILAIATTVTMAIAGVLVFGSPAWAAKSDCSSSKLCVWKDVNYNGEMYYWNPPAVGTHTPIGGSWNDQISSVYNRTHLKATLYASASCSGVNNAPLLPGESGSLWLGMNDSTSCILWTLP